MTGASQRTTAFSLAQMHCEPKVTDALELSLSRAVLPHDACWMPIVKLSQKSSNLRPVKLEPRLVMILLGITNLWMMSLVSSQEFIFAWACDSLLCVY